jgi:hypothetical protein
VTARRAKRENGGLGEDPPGSTMTFTNRSFGPGCSVSQGNLRREGRHTRMLWEVSKCIYLSELYITKQQRTTSNLNRLFPGRNEINRNDQDIRRESPPTPFSVPPKAH